MSARAAWAGVIVSDLATSVAWYAKQLRAEVLVQEGGWAKLGFLNGSTVELFAGDRADPGGSFPSYGHDDGPAVMPGYAVDDPGGLAIGLGLEVSRFLPGWVVVAAPDRLRIVLLSTPLRQGAGLVSFELASGNCAAQQTFLDRLTVEGPPVAVGPCEVVPVIRGPRAAELVDPDGFRIRMIGAERLL